MGMGSREMEGMVMCPKPQASGQRDLGSVLKYNTSTF